MTRKSLRARYDAVVRLDPTRGSVPDYAFGLVKYTHAIEGGRCVLTDPEPLVHDVWSEEPLEPRLPTGSDFWFHKLATDVVVRGAAYHPGGRLIESAQASVSLGQHTKQIAVFGRRQVSWRRDGTPQFSSPEPAESVPLLYQLAYGGLDARVPVSEEELPGYMDLVRAGLAYDHPGLYPRNPVGKGYVVYPEPLEGLELPNLEDPQDLLTPERLVTGAPERWYRQPLPWCFEWAVGATFPRCRYLGVEPWYTAPDGTELPEIARGFCPPGLLGLGQESARELGYLQEASLGMIFPHSLAGQSVSLRGMHPERPEITFTVPRAPRLEFQIEGHREVVEPRLLNLVIHPREMRFTTTYGAKTAGLPRAFVPGVHRQIPLALRVDDDEPIHHLAPETIMDRLHAAKVQGRGELG